MTTTELEQVIRDYLRDIYKREYVGKIKITPLLPVGYHINFYMAVDDLPITFHAELEDSKFLKLLKEDLRSRNFHLSWFGLLRHVYPYNRCPISSSCNDKG